MKLTKEEIQNTMFELQYKINPFIGKTLTTGELDSDYINIISKAIKELEATLEKHFPTKDITPEEKKQTLENSFAIVSQSKHFLDNVNHYREKMTNEELLEKVKKYQFYFFKHNKIIENLLK